MTRADCLHRIRGWEVSRRGIARYVGVAGIVDGDCVSSVITVTAEECRVDQGRARTIQLGNERVTQKTVQCRMQRVENGKISGVGFTGYISVTGIIDDDARSSIVQESAQKSRIDESRAVSVQLRDESVCFTAVWCLYWRAGGEVE